METIVKSHKMSNAEIAKHLKEHYDGGSKKALFIETMKHFFQRKTFSNFY